MTRLALAALLALAACHHGSTTDEDERAISAALEGWELAGLPEPGLRCEIEHVVVVRAGSLAEQREYCPHATERTAACLAQVPFGLRRHAPTVVLRHGQELDRYGEPVIHEMLHQLRRCTLLRPVGYDLEHVDPRVWVATGGAESAQGRARSVYLSPD